MFVDQSAQDDALQRQLVTIVNQATHDEAMPKHLGPATAGQVTTCLRAVGTILQGKFISLFHSPAKETNKKGAVTKTIMAGNR